MRLLTTVRSKFFSGVVPTLVQSKDAPILCSEVMALLAKGAIEMVPPALSESGFLRLYKFSLKLNSLFNFPFPTSVPGVNDLYLQQNRLDRFEVT